MQLNFGLAGHPLGHSMSPFIHERLLSLSNLSGCYSLFDIPPKELPFKMPELDRLVGYNVTIPHKVEIIRYLDRLDESAERYGSVNCVANKSSKRIGYNTDCLGFLRALEAEGLSLSGNVLLLGCGGAGRTFAAETVFHGGSLTIMTRKGSEEKALSVSENIKKSVPSAEIYITSGDIPDREFDIVLNSTPAGMFPNTNECPVSDAVLRRCGAAFDAVYNPSETLLIKKMHSMGKKAVGGMSMLVWQAAASHEIWNGSEFLSGDIKALISEAENRLRLAFPVK